MHYDVFRSSSRLTCFRLALFTTNNKRRHPSCQIPAEPNPLNRVMLTAWLAGVEMSPTIPDLTRQCLFQLETFVPLVSCDFYYTKLWPSVLSYLFDKQWRRHFAYT